MYVFRIFIGSQSNTQLLAHVELYFPVWLDLDKVPQVVRDDLLEDGAAFSRVRLGGPLPSALKEET